MKDLRVEVSSDGEDAAKSDDDRRLGFSRHIFVLLGLKAEQGNAANATKARETKRRTLTIVDRDTAERLQEGCLDFICC